MKISLLTPSRGRPQFMKRLIVSAIDKAENPENIKAVFYIDSDDIRSYEMYRQIRVNYFGQVDAIIGPRVIVSKMWNKCAEIATGEIMMHCGDDIVFRTKNWDALVINEFKKVPDRILFVFGRDGITPDELEFGTHGFLHRNWVDTVGYFVPPYFSYGLNDEWLTDVATMIGRKKFIPELYTEHMHHAVGKASMDKTYFDMIQWGMNRDRKKMWEDTLPEREGDAEKLRKFIKEF